MFLYFLFIFCFSVLFVLLVTAIIDFFEGGDGGTMLRDAWDTIKHWFKNDPKEADAFLPRTVELVAYELGWRRRPDLDTGSVHAWQTPEGFIYAAQPGQVPTVALVV